MPERNATPEQITVAAAIIERNGKLLVCRRPPGARQAGLWEFPGGKVEPGEDPREALRRELREELGVEAEIGRPREVVLYRYDFAAVLLIFFDTKLLAGEPEPLHHEEIRWVPQGDLSAVNFLQADRELVDKLFSA
jgi:8-oxo-dGTP diphosphatase